MTAAARAVQELLAYVHAYWSMGTKLVSVTALDTSKGIALKEASRTET